jgi:L-ascorbate metabolism protein UlaG (beta-lactamase superfamily)
MMKIVITALMSVTLAVAPDTIPATGGNITIQPINHATLELTYGGKVIDIDPVAQANFEGLAAPDIILVTDIHQDHLDPSTVAKRKKDTTKIVAPPAAASTRNASPR